MSGVALWYGVGGRRRELLAHRAMHEQKYHLPGSARCSGHKLCTLLHNPPPELLIAPENTGGVPPLAHESPAPTASTSSAASGLGAPRLPRGGLQPRCVRTSLGRLGAFLARSGPPRNPGCCCWHHHLRCATSPFHCIPPHHPPILHSSLLPSNLHLPTLSASSLPPDFVAQHHPLLYPHGNPACLSL